MPPRPEKDRKRDHEKKVREAGFDHTIEESFPASDPPSSIPNPRDPDAMEEAAEEAAEEDDE